jgi:hypothetical protein
MRIAWFDDDWTALAGMERDASAELKTTCLAGLGRSLGLHQHRVV